MSAYPRYWGNWARRRCNLFVAGGVPLRVAHEFARLEAQSRARLAVSVGTKVAREAELVPLNQHDDDPRFGLSFDIDKKAAVRLAKQTAAIF